MKLGSTIVRWIGMPADRCSFGPHRRPYDPSALQLLGMPELDMYACPDCLRALAEEARTESRRKSCDAGRPGAP
jgi:hypothetical protein